MDIRTLLSIILAITSLVVSGVALWLPLKEQSKIEIESVHPCLASWKGTEDHQWKHQIKSIDVELGLYGAQ